MGSVLEPYKGAAGLFIWSLQTQGSCGFYESLEGCSWLVFFPASSYLTAFNSCVCGQELFACCHTRNRFYWVEQI